MRTLHCCKVSQPLDQLASYQAAIEENPKNGETSFTGGRRKRAVGQWSKFWGNGRTLTIAFMFDLPDALRTRIGKIIRQWEPSTNLTFKFVEGVAGDIRIATHTSYNQSDVGTDALLTPLDEPTLTLATPPDDSNFETVVLHEFGHALGLQHEHLHPKANIPWDRPKVYDFYKSNFGWSTEEIDFNLFTPLETSDLLRGPYDRDSIMHYRIENELTVGDWEVGLNTKISMLDRRNMRKAYPKR